MESEPILHRYHCFSCRSSWESTQDWNNGMGFYSCDECNRNTYWVHDTTVCKGCKRLENLKN